MHTLEDEFQEAVFQVKNTQELLEVNRKIYNKLIVFKLDVDSLDGLLNYREALLLEPTIVTLERALSKYQGRLEDIKNRQETIYTESRDPESWKALFNELWKIAKKRNSEDLKNQLKAYEYEFAKGETVLGSKTWSNIYATLKHAVNSN